MADEDLTSVARVKDFLKLTGDVDDGLLQALVTRYSVAVQKTYLNRTMGAADYSKRFNGWGGVKWVFPEWPAISVSNVQIGDVNTAPLVFDTDYYFDEKNLYLIDCGFVRGVGNCRVSWRAGYVTIPEDLDQVVAELVSFIYRSRDNLTASSKTVAGETISFIQEIGPKRVIDVLNSYRKVFPG